MPDIKPLTKDELVTVLAENRKEEERSSLSGIKYFRMPVEHATPVNGSVTLGMNRISGPHSGYMWSIRRLAASGLGTGTAPDVLNIYRSGTTSIPIWQLNGNNWGYTFGPTEMLLLPGEALVAASLGSLVSTVQISVTCDVVEVPAEMIGKLVI